MIDGGRNPRGGLRRLGEGDPTDLLRGGDGVSTIHSPPSEPDRAPRCARAERGELRAAYEAELSRITPARHDPAGGGVAAEPRRRRRLGLGRAGPEGERDLEQVRDAIDGVRALLAILERACRQELRPLRDALSQLQIAYAREAPAGGADTSACVPATGFGAGRAAAGRRARRPPRRVRRGRPPPRIDPVRHPTQGKPGAGPAESSGRLWVRTGALSAPLENSFPGAAR